VGSRALSAGGKWGWSSFHLMLIGSCSQSQTWPTTKEFPFHRSPCSTDPMNSRAGRQRRINSVAALVGYALPGCSNAVQLPHAEGTSSVGMVSIATQCDACRHEQHCSSTVAAVRVFFMRSSAGPSEHRAHTTVVLSGVRRCRMTVPSRRYKPSNPTRCQVARAILCRADTPEEGPSRTLAVTHPPAPHHAVSLS
jgi:hypothetical protein